MNKPHINITDPSSTIYVLTSPKGQGQWSTWAEFASLRDAAFGPDSTWRVDDDSFSAIADANEADDHAKAVELLAAELHDSFDVAVVSDPSPWTDGADN